MLTLRLHSLRTERTSLMGSLRLGLSAALAAALRDLPVIRRKCSVIPSAIAKVALKVGRLTFATDCTNVCNPVLTAARHAPSETANSEVGEPSAVQKR